MAASGAIIQNTVCSGRFSKSSPSLQSRIGGRILINGIIQSNYVILERYIGSSGIARKLGETVFDL